MENSFNLESNLRWNKKFELLSQLTVLVGHQKFDQAWKETIENFIDQGMSLNHVEECILHLGIYYGLPRSLQSFSELKKIDLNSVKTQNKTIASNNEGMELRVKSFVPDQFNFFKQPDIQKALYEVHPDFGWLAGTTASSLCSRGVLNALERAHITLISDICQNVFNGPFQIHIRMMLQSGATPEFIYKAIQSLRQLNEESEDFVVPNEYIDHAEKILPDLIQQYQSFIYFK